MTEAIANVAITDTFSTWMTRTNQLATAMRNSVLSKTTPLVGDAAINGTFSGWNFSSNTLFANSANFRVLTVNSNPVWHSGNMGTGSGLDADLLGGRPATYYATLAHVHDAAAITTGVFSEARFPERLREAAALATDANLITASGYYRFETGGTNLPVAAIGYLWHTRFDTGADYQEFQVYNSNVRYARRRLSNAWNSWYLITPQNAAVLTEGTLADARLPSRLGTDSLLVTNANTIVANGFYRVAAGATNVPLNAIGYIQHLRISSTSEMQLWSAEDGLRTYARNKVANVWGSWFETTSNITFLDGRFAPVIHTHNFADLTAKPTTLAGYGITDAALATHIHTFAQITAKPTTLAGYGITDAALATHVHSFAQLTNKPTTLAGYGIMDATGVSNTPTWGGPLGTQNLNSVTSIGFYHQPTTASATSARNYPSVEVGMLQVYANLDTPDFVTQTYITVSGLAYFRSRSGGIWASWTTFSPSDHVHTFAQILSKPTTLAGYGITDAALANHVHNWSEINNRPTTLAGYGITDAALATHVHTWAQISAKPTTLSGYGITDAALANHEHTFAQILSKPTTLAGYGITDTILAPNGNGSQLTSLNASALGSGTVPDNRMGTTTAYSLGPLTIAGGINATGVVSAAGGLSAYSDIRLKDNVHTFENALTHVKNLRGVRYTRDGHANIGVIAQEVQEVIPEVVVTGDTDDKYLSVMYGNLAAVFIEAIKELSARVEELEKK